MWQPSAISVMKAISESWRGVISVSAKAQLIESRRKANNLWRRKWLEIIISAKAG